MHEAAQKLHGEHDYRNLCKMDVANGVTNFTRKILDTRIHIQNDRYLSLYIVAVHPIDYFNSYGWCK